MAIIIIIMKNMTTENWYDLEKRTSFQIIRHIYECSVSPLCFFEQHGDVVNITSATSSSQCISGTHLRLGQPEPLRSQKISHPQFNLILGPHIYRASE
uniref:Uncharacterized protein n=1 Tax=Arion vulgaris TaxID=1028688 RepID=A0A0B7B434_9EUPU